MYLPVYVMQKRTLAKATIAGKVVDANGAGVAGATVTVESQFITAVTAADGSFNLTNVSSGFVYLYATAPSTSYLDGETLNAVFAAEGDSVSGVKITLSGRPSAAATTVGMTVCKACHIAAWPEMFAALDGSADAAAHSRFVVEGTSHMVYPELWPAPGDKYLPRNPTGGLLMVQDPLDGKGLVNVVLCTRDGNAGREYLFKFYPQLPDGAPARTANDLDCAETEGAVVIPVAATIGGEGNWGEGYTDPAHATADRLPNFGERKQRFMARIQDVPYLVTWMEENSVPINRAKQDYVAYLPVYVVQDGTPVGSPSLAAGDVGTPKFWQKSPDHWCTPDNTLSRNCAGCHSTGVKIEYQDFTAGEEPFKAVVTAFDYNDLNVTCERCHGPGSEHAATASKLKIISPQYLTAKAGNELCGQCHASHAGKSATPSGIFKYSFDATYKNTLGNGFFVPGVYDLSTFVYNLNLPTATLKEDWKAGSFHSRPDKTHSRAHSQQQPEMVQSMHAISVYEKLTCYTCHDSHTLDGGPARLAVGSYEFMKPGYGNNALCLTCHATHGPFEAVSKDDAAVLTIDGGGHVSKSGQALTFSPAEATAARDRVAQTVKDHMEADAGMDSDLYTPENPALAVGNCASCHMPKIGKLQDINDDAQYHLVPDQNGMSAVAEGNVSSHVFDIVWPSQSSAMKNPNPAAGHDYDIMPNSCGKCHASARFSGDMD